MANPSFLAAFGAPLSVSAASTTAYSPVSGILQSNSTEDRVRTYVPAGTLKKLVIRVTSNARTTNTTFTVRVNGVDTALTVTVGSGATGKFTSTGTVSVSAGDYVTIKSVTGTGSSTLNWANSGVVFEPTSGGATSYAAFDTTTNAMDLTGTTSQFMFAAGWINVPSTASSSASRFEYRVMEAGTVSEIGIMISANSKAADTVFNLYKNGSATGASVTVTASTTGWFRATGLSVSVSPGDALVFQSTPTVTGTVTIRRITTLIRNTSSAFQISSAGSVSSYTSSSVGYNAPTIPTYRRATESDTQIDFDDLYVIKSVGINASANGTFDVNSRINGANSGPSASVPVATQFTQSADSTQTVIAGDLWTLGVTVSASPRDVYGFGVVLDSNTGTTVNPGAGSLAFTGLQPTSAFNLTATPGAGSLAFTGRQPTATSTAINAAGKGSLTFTGAAPSVAPLPRPGAGSLVFTGLQPTSGPAVVARTTQAGASILGLNAPGARATQFGAELLAINATGLRVTQAGVNALAVNLTRARITQMGLLVLAKGGTPPPTPSPLGLVPNSRKEIIKKRLVNMYFETTPDGPAPDARIGRPGLRQLGQRGSGPVYALFNWQGYQFTVSGTSVWRDNENIGTIIPGDYVRYATSETEIVLVTGGRAYYVTTDDVVQIADVDIPDPVIDVLYSGAAGRFLYLSGVAGQARAYYSEVGDAREVDALSFFTAESKPDALVAGVVLGNDVLLFGKNSVDWYYATGDNDAPFSSSSGRAYTRGLAARETLVLADNSAFFVGDDRMVYRVGQVPQKVSDFDVDNDLRKLSDEALSSAWAFSVPIAGHLFYVLSLPGLTTWAFDVENQRWTEWKSYGKANFRVRTADGFYLGDQYGGRIMQFDATLFTDLGDPLERITSAYLRHTGKPQKNWSLWLQAVRGVGTAADCVDPSVEMRFSDNEGCTWSEWRPAPLGPMGHADNKGKAVWDQLGTVKMPGRLYEFRVTDPVEFTPYAVYYNENGRGTD